MLSQASEGWVLIGESYDDGGLSGGTLERPALQRLLSDVAAGLVDIIVIYKLDRLTRSLLDFAKLVETLDRAGTSFVSVTQSFNTTTSMGRLTLNMLLSFAQFEREVTAERIRDKIAASKAKGMWMGGIPPLGYRPHGRTLMEEPEQAELVRGIYARYRTCGTVRLLAEALIADGESTAAQDRKRTRLWRSAVLARSALRDPAQSDLHRAYCPPQCPARGPARGDNRDGCVGGGTAPTRRQGPRRAAWRCAYRQRACRTDRRRSRGTADCSPCPQGRAALPLLRQQGASRVRTG